METIDPSTRTRVAASPQRPSAGNQSSSCADGVVLLFTLTWVITTVFIRHFITLATTVTPGRGATYAALGGALVLAGAAAVLLLPLALWWKSPRPRGLFQGWTLAAGLTLLLAPVNLLPASSAQPRFLLQIILVLLYCGLIVWIARRNPARLAPGTGASLRIDWLVALLAGILAWIPWLRWGALGSLLDTLLALALGLATGLAAALLVELFIRPELRSSQAPPAAVPDETGLPPARPASDPFVTFLLDGVGSSLVILLLVSALALPYGGLQIMLMLSLPALGWLMAALEIGRPAAAGRSAASRVAPLAVMLGLASAAPLALVDADELLLVVMIAAGEMLQWAFLAAFAAAGILLLVAGITALAAWIGRRGAPEEPSAAPDRLTTILLGLAVVSVAVFAVLTYWGPGKPGWYGERIFIILKDQADVSQAARVSDPKQRRQQVYKTLVDKADASQAGIRSMLDRFGLPYTPYYLVNAIEAPDTPLLRLWLSTRPEVDRVLDSPQLRPLPAKQPVSSGNAEAPTKPQWNLTMIGADKVWNELDFTGQGIIIGQSDSGVQGDHPELASAYLGAGGSNDYHWFDPWNHTSQPTDIGGHGTHTLGSILGKHTGVAPGAQWIGCVNLARNLGNPGLYLDCWQFMLAPFPQDGNPLKDGDPSRGAQVLNNSWGCPAEEGCDINTFSQAARALTEAGLFIVASAGNDGPGCATLNTPPPVYDDTFAVGAVDKTGQLAYFSSIGPVTADGSGRVKPDIIAPGENVLSSFPNNTYAYESGTSMAGPHVAGVVALMWSANPKLVGDYQTTADILRATARPYTGTLPDCPGASDHPSTAVGYGIVDAYAAVQAAIKLR